MYWNRIMRKLHAKCWTFRHRFQQKEKCGLGEFKSFDLGLLCLTRFWCCLPLGHTLWSVWFLVFDFFFLLLALALSSRRHIFIISKCWKDIIYLFYRYFTTFFCVAMVGKVYGKRKSKEKKKTKVVWILFEVSFAMLGGQWQKWKIWISNSRWSG